MSALICLYTGEYILPFKIPSTRVGAFVCEGADPGGIYILKGWRAQQVSMFTNSLRGLFTLVALKMFFAPSLKISSALSAVAFELDSPEQESGEDSTTPCGVKGAVGPGSRAQIRLAAEKT